MAKKNQDEIGARLFIAFSLPDELQDHLQQLQKKLNAVAPAEAFRWIHAENTHVTLHFLGDTDRDKIPVIENCMVKAVQNEQSEGRSGRIRCQLGGLGYFPKKGDPRVCWIGFNELLQKQSHELHPRGRTLFTTLERELSKSGLQSTSPRYTPHISLGYRRRDCDSQKVKLVLAAWEQSIQTKGLAFSISDLTLYESYVSEKGREHKALKKITL